MQVGPCNSGSEPFQAFLIAMNVLQTVLIAYVTRRAIRKNDEDKRANGQSAK